ncbi:MAG: hypothetical protein WCK93_11710 [Nitrosomonadales bacterium]
MNALWTTLLILLSNLAFSAPLSELIDKNVQSATRAYEMSLPVAAALPDAPSPVTSTVQLWIHIRNSNQIELAQDISQKLSQAKSQLWNIEQKPIQKVDDGPLKSQLRYFKREDRPQAQKLLATLRKSIPKTELCDMSGKFEQAGWVKPGHYELWLSPDVSKLKK